MKRYLALFIVSFFMALRVWGQAPLDEVSKSLQLGEPSKTAKYFDKVIDITIQNEQSTYSKSQAEMVLKNFFSKNPPKNFWIKHRGNGPSDNSVFIIGELATAADTFKVYLFFKLKEGNYYIQELRMEQ